MDILDAYFIAGGRFQVVPIRKATELWEVPMPKPIAAQHLSEGPDSTVKKLKSECILAYEVNFILRE